MKPFREAIEERVLILDGAMGTMLQERGLQPGQSPEELNLTMPEVVASVHRDYIEAGADIIVTNTFGGTRFKLAHYGLEERLIEINSRAVEIARAAAGTKAYVGASIGPTGQFVEPLGEVSFDRMKGAFREQAEALVGAGADLITLETFLDIKECRAAVIAIREVSATIPVIAMLTFDDNGRSVLGTPPEAAAITLAAAGADIVGSNCGLGVDGIYDILCRMRQVTGLPLISQANAGLPQLVGDRTVFPGTPDEMVAYHERMIALGVRIIGGCCGTTPAHIRAMKQALASRQKSWFPGVHQSGATFLSSRSGWVKVGAGTTTAIIGERINPTGKKLYSQELQEGKVTYIRREAIDQVQAGAALLDVNVGAPGIDEPSAMQRAVFCASGAVTVPLVLDSSSPAALEAGLKAADGKVLINSVSGEAKSLKKVLPLAKKYGAAIIGLALDRKGIPETAEGRVAVARRIRNAARRLDIPDSDIIIDCLTLTVSAEQKRAAESLRAIRLVKQKLGLSTVLGVSNISFGLPQRPLISSAFFAMAMEAGLDAAIINPKDKPMMDAWRSAMVLLNRDHQASAYIEAYRDQQTAAVQQAPPAGTGCTILERLSQAVIGGDRDGIVALVEQALAEGTAPLEISNGGLLPGLEEVGRRFERNIYFLPQVMQSADTMQAGFARLKEEMKGQAFQSKGRILMATVEGDIHDIGKNVSAATIISQAKEFAVDAVGLSALMTTTMSEMDNVLKKLRAAGVKTFTMVGGAVVTQEYADSIGADLYAKDAMEAVAKIKLLLGDRD
ncbi:MAG: homocysteine S-methyltransferase family protein [Desulfuromonadaceae bacterium]